MAELLPYFPNIIVDIMMVKLTQKKKLFSQVSFL